MNDFTIKERLAKSVVLAAALYCSAAVAQGQGYIPPDYYGDEHKGADIIRKNMGQVLDTDGHQRNDVKAYFEGSPLGIWLRDSSRVSFTFDVMHNDSITPDTAYRLDMAIGATKLIGPQLLVNAPGLANYYRGAIAAEQVPAYRRAFYGDVLHNIDFHVYGSSAGPRMAFVVRPGGEPSQIKLVFTGQDSINIDWEGALKIYLNGKWVKLEQAVAYQVATNGSLITLGWTAHYTHEDSSVVAGFDFDTYDQNLPLVLQIGYAAMAMGGGTDYRNMTWSTYMGNTGGDELTCVEVDGAGDPYLCGYTWSENFPVDPGNSVFNPFIGESPGEDNAVIMKFQASNKQLAWATYYGGGTAFTEGNLAKTEARKLALYHGASGEMQYAFVVGTTNCEDFDSYASPISVFSNAVQEAYLGGLHRMWVGAFAKTNGVRAWATTHGEVDTETWYEEGLCIALGPFGELAVGGRIWEYSGVPEFPLVTPANAYAQDVGGGFVMLFDEEFNIKWSSTFAGYHGSIPPYTQVTDLRFTRNNGSTKLWLTGANYGYQENGFAYTPPPAGGFFHTDGHVFLASFDVPSLQLDYCTGWGRFDASEIGYGLDYDGKHLWLVGGTEAQDLTDEDCPDPGGTGVYHTYNNGGNQPGRKCDGFILAFDPEDYVLNYGTLIGGSYYDMLLDVTHDARNVYITGETRSTTTFAEDMGPNYYFQPLNANQTSRDAVVLALSKDVTSPTMLWRTAYGGIKSERGWGITVSPSEVYLTGATGSNAWEAFPLLEFDPDSPLDFYQDYNFGGVGYGFLEFYHFDFGLNFGHPFFGEGGPEPLYQTHDGFIASFNIDYQVGVDGFQWPSQTLSVTPLPVAGQWTVLFPHAGPWTVRAYNTAGQEVRSRTVSGPSALVDLSALSGGAYLLVATAPDGGRYGAKVIRP